MPDFNLTRDPWIPVRWLDGQRSLVGLDIAFREASRIADLDAPPHERVALVRLLVCILQAACGAPESDYDWPTFGTDLEAETTAYLARPDIASHFELFGDGPRFLQVKVPAKSEPVPTSKLIPDMATGNNPTVYDHFAGPDRALSPARLALGLLAFQAFYPLYGAGYKGKGPCVDGNMVHTLLLGASLRETLILNSLDQDSLRLVAGGGMGRPIWELTGKDAPAIATTTYLGRLVPRHRDLWLEDDGKGFSLRQESFQYPTYPDAREPSATLVRTEKNDETRVLPARLNRALWRDLDLITTLKKKDDDFQSSPLTLQSHIHEQDSGEVHLWSGALVTDLKAKILDTVESVFTVPHDLFTSTGRRFYHLGVAHAENQAKSIWAAVKTYADTLKHEAAPVEAAQRHFWHSLDQRRQLLLDLVKDPSVLGTAPFGEGNDPWTKAVWHAAREAYFHACPAGDNPRLIQAHVEGLKRLRPKISAKKKAKPQPLSP